MKLPVVNLPMQTLEDSTSSNFALEKYDDKIPIPTFTKLPVMSNVEPVFYPSMLAIPSSIAENYWIPAPSNFETLTEQINGENYIENSSGVFATKDGEISKRIINAKIRITKILCIWQSDISSTRHLVCEVQISGDMHPYEITIPENSFKDIFKHIRKKIPAANVSETSSEAGQTYLTDVFNRDIGHCAVETMALKMGWFDFGNGINYYKGTDEFYQTIMIPKVNETDRQIIFEQAWDFLNVGKFGETITAIWLMAHIAFTSYWLRKGKHPFSSVLYVKGATNLLKTSVVKIVSNPFDENRDNATVRMTSTSAGICNILTMLQDNLVCIDDFSNTELSSKRKALENAENVIRAVGDGVFPVKMNVNDFSKSVRENVRVTVILTGEEKLDLGTSSQYRIIEVFVDKDTFDGNLLRKFQQNHQIMARYFSLYIEFLKRYGSQIANQVHQAVMAYENQVFEKFSVKRFTESAAILRFQIEIMMYFAKYCDIDESVVMQLRQRLSQNLMSIMQKNQNEGEQLNPELKFLYGLFQSLETNKNCQIAKNETEYVESEDKFIGFKKPSSNELWLRAEDAYDAVIKFYKKRSEDFLVKWDTIKKLLLTQGYSDGVLASNGNSAQYLRKASRGTRKRMLVLKIEKVEQALGNLKGEI